MESISLVHTSALQEDTVKNVYHTFQDLYELEATSTVLVYFVTRSFLKNTVYYQIKKTKLIPETEIPDTH